MGIGSPMWGSINILLLYSLWDVSLKLHLENFYIPIQTNNKTYLEAKLLFIHAWTVILDIFFFREYCLVSQEGCKCWTNHCYHFVITIK